MRRSGIPAIFKQALRVQVIAAAGAALVAGYFGTTAGLSAACGGLAVVVANAYSAWRVFAGSEQESAEQALSTLYRAETGKLVMLGALFVAIFAGWRNVDIVAFIAGCAAAMIAGVIPAVLQKVDQDISHTGGTGNETDG